MLFIRKMHLPGSIKLLSSFILWLIQNRIQNQSTLLIYIFHELMKCMLKTIKFKIALHF